jgi:hypothetical protein
VLVLCADLARLRAIGIYTALGGDLGKHYEGAGKPRPIVVFPAFANDINSPCVVATSTPVTRGTAARVANDRQHRTFPDDAYDATRA